MAGTQIDPTLLDPAKLAGMTGQLRAALATIRSGQEAAGTDASDTTTGIEQLDGLRNQLGKLVEKQFVGALNQMSARAFSQAVASGKWPQGYVPTNERNVGRNDSMLGVEVSAAGTGLGRLEHTGESTEASLIVPEFTRQEIAIADLVILVLDYAAARKLKLGEAVLALHTHNINK